MICYLSIVAIFSKFYKSHFAKRNMEDEIPEFGLKRTEDYQTKYLNKPVILRPQNNMAISGKLIKIIQGYFVLNPFQAGILENGIWKYYLRDMPPGMSIPIANTSIEPTTFKEIENYFNSAYDLAVSNFKKSNN